MSHNDPFKPSHAQAGVALGLAKKVHLEYKVWGGDFATTIVSVVVINQLVGPPLCKWVMKYIHEKHLRDGMGDEEEQIVDSRDEDPSHPGLSRRGHRKKTSFPGTFAEAKVHMLDDEDAEGSALLQSEHEDDSAPPAGGVRPHWLHALASGSITDPIAPRIYIVGCGSYTKANSSPSIQWVKEVAAQYSVRMAAAGLRPTVFSIPSAAVMVPPTPTPSNNKKDEDEDLQGDADAAIASGLVAAVADVKVKLHRQDVTRAGVGHTHQ